MFFFFDPINGIDFALYEKGAWIAGRIEKCAGIGICSIGRREGEWHRGILAFDLDRCIAVMIVKNDIFDFINIEKKIDGEDSLIKRVLIND